MERFLEERVVRILSVAKGGKNGAGARGPFRKRVPAQPVDATPPDMSFSSKGGAHESRETMEAVFDPAGRYVEPLEGGTVIT
jgi:hypothetical protein